MTLVGGYKFLWLLKPPANASARNDLGYLALHAQGGSEKHQYPGRHRCADMVGQPVRQEYLTASSTPSENAQLMPNEQTTVAGGNVKESTTTFADSSYEETQVFNTAPIPSQPLPVRDQTVCDFMSKPVVIARGSWTTTNVANDVLGVFRIEDYLSLDMWAKKHAGFNLLRGTAMIRIVANANPFQQGKLIASLIPCAGNLTDGETRFRRDNLCQRTQQPNVEFDCRDATAVICVPYISPHDYYTKVGPSFGWGDVYLSVLSPLETGAGGNTSIDYTVFMSFENFEMASPLVPQSGSSGKRRSGRPKVAMVASRNEAESVTSSGSLTRGLMSAAKVASDIASIPYLNAIAQPASWVLRGMSGAASWFGWSKPMTVSAPTQVYRRNLSNMPNATGVDTGVNLGLYHDSRVEVVPNMAGNPADEMSFEYLKKRKAWTNDYVWTTSDVADDTIGTLYLQPTGIYAQNNMLVGAGAFYTVRHYPPFGYISRYFKQWRGSLVLTIKFVKTDYHTGRLVITFFPGTTTPPSSTVEEGSYVLREIIDIRDNNEVVFKFPYLLAQKYIKNDQFSGVAKITVLNELRAPETASTNVHLLCYWSAGDDFEVQIPGTSAPLADKPVPLVAQSGSAPGDTLISETMGNYPEAELSSAMSSMCVGEHFSSVKQMLSRSTPILTRDPLTTGDGGYPAFYPFTMTPCTSNSVTGLFQQPTFTGDALTCFAPGYAFWRGSVNFTVVNPSAINSVPSVAIAPFATEYGPPVFANAASGYDQLLTNVTSQENANFSNSLGAVQSFDNGVGSMEFNVPYYGDCHMSMVHTHVGAEGPITRELASPQNFVICTFGGFLNQPLRLYRSCGDEFQLSYFLGFPPMYVSYTP